MNNHLLILHKKHIALTPKDSIVIKRRSFIANIAEAIQLNQLKSRRIYISTFCLKHLYDKRTALEYEYILHNLHIIFSNPDAIYKNLDGRIGSLVFHKNLKDGNYIGIIDLGKRKEQPNYILTSFRVEEDKLCKFQIVWKREAGPPPSSR